MGPIPQGATDEVEVSRVCCAGGRSPAVPPLGPEDVSCGPTLLTSDEGGLRLPPTVSCQEAASEGQILKENPRCGPAQAPAAFRLVAYCKSEPQTLQQLRLVTATV